MSQQPPTDPNNDLAVLAQFCAEYLHTMRHKPATAACVKQQMDCSLRRVSEALNQGQPSDLVT